ncbi:hypothetical protein [Curtobacterium sp. MCSS17_007]|uniref:hypothetical protein n=1 Tax=Curtobacterium sp. MCSS17_007 TaxID=2175646 RepID=UPI0011B625BA|nr:hypothetical protein [Curtobacterium sp. MCSS17_007]WIE75142.1 hypothetical protein DEJ22_012905 [Curtobacterium sp. MCSS17_007]
MPIDAAGLTQEDVSRMSLHEEFDRYHQHYERMQQVLAAAQRQVHDSEWRWTMGDRVPSGGGNENSVVPMAGSTIDNSYALDTSRVWSSPVAGNDRRALQPMIGYFDDQGWLWRERTLGKDHDVWAVTDDGWRIRYLVINNGNHALTVYSGQYWTNDSLALTEAIGGRNDAAYPEESLPGEYPPFPKWSDAIIRPPKI